MAGSSKHKVLIVDDERLVADTLMKIFTMAGYNARAVYSAEEALTAVKQTGWMPQLTIVDVFLPKMNGIDLTIMLKRECPDCRVSLLSGQPGTADLLEAAARNGHTFPVLPKPTQPATVLEFSTSLLASAAEPSIPS